MRRNLTRRQALRLGGGVLSGAYVLGGTTYGMLRGRSGEGTFSLGNIGWTENVAVSNLTKVLMEDELGYDNVEIVGPLDLGPLFVGVAGGDLAAFQDVWLPNNQQYLDKVQVKNNVHLLKPWYQAKTEYGLAVPDYMDAKSIADLKDVKTDTITGIEPGASFMPVIRKKVIPAYDLNMKLATSSTAGMLSQLEKKYKRKKPIVFVAWSPHWMNTEYDFHYLDDPKKAQGSFADPSRLAAVVNKDLPDKHPTAYALLKAVSLDKQQTNKLETQIRTEGDTDPSRGVHKWLDKNSDVVHPWVEKAKKA